MSRTPLGPVLRHLHRLAGAAVSLRLTDSHLLRRFAAERDEDAFAELMRRHGPLVLNVCSRILGNEQDAEDAFQAAFLVLARKAGAIRKGESVGSFLYGVAYRIAMKERGKLAQRRQHDLKVEQRTPAGPLYEAAFRELQMLLDEGLNRLPEKYRTPFVLCCLEGKSKSEAARELGWKEGTVSSRLAQARKKLQQFLSRKGVTLAAALTAVGIAENGVSASVPPLLAASAVRAAALFASDSPAVIETIKAVQLAESMLRSLAALPWKTATVLLMVVSLAVGGAGMAYHSEKAEQTPANETPKAALMNTAQNPPREPEKPRTDRYGDPLPEGALARLGTIRFRQGFLIRQVAFSPNGKIVACAGAGRGVCLWDVATGKELRQINRNTHADAVAFSPDGNLLACSLSNGSDRGTALYETHSGRKIADLSDVSASFSFAPNGKILAGVIVPGVAVHFYDAANGERLKKEFRAGAEDKEIRRLAWSPDSKRLAWVGAGGFIHLWDVDRGEEIARWQGHAKILSFVAFSPDGKTVATASQDEGTIHLWDAATHEKRHILVSKDQRVWAVVFSHDGRTLASGHHDGTIVLWDTSQGKEIRRWQAHAFSVSSLDWSPDNKTLVSGAIWECGPRLWDAATGTEIRSFAGHTAPVERVMFSPDGKRILSRGREQKILNWDLKTGRENLYLKSPLQVPLGAFDHGELSPQGDVIASWSYKDDKIRLLDAATRKERIAVGKFNNTEKESFFRAALAFSPDGRSLAFGTKEGVVGVCDTSTGVNRRFKWLSAPVLCVAFSHDEQTIAAGMGRASATIALWDAKTGKSLAEFSSKERVDRLAFSPDGKMLASASWVRRAPRLWDATTGRLIRSLTSVSALYDIAFSSDGKWLAGAGYDDDQKVHVWEVNTGAEVQSFRGHIGPVISIAFAPDGRTLASGGGDSSILLWDLTGRIRAGRFQTVKWTPRELEKRWIDLAGTGTQAMQALWDFVASPEQTVPLLCQRIMPVEPADAQRAERLIRDLDSNDFGIRAKATEELEKIVDGGVEPALRKKLTENVSLEMRQRIQQVLSKLEPSASAERLRALRAIQVLEYMGTAEAKEHLRSLAGGLSQARLTREAKSALDRLAK